ncbi:hypothetical protein T02_8416 [Trichinella nativa]|uniref:Uncharacterized protein n=1 Tax=Trichinella nativa TaxID=6335 RepID=A0A0V1L8G3_9BILA|nr:hypothetical protein T06_4027 [Trichinella sp. T6]KRZ55833.1 hypothetical protein T02_8416 [Trichinella nativa]
MVFVLHKLCNECWNCCSNSAFDHCSAETLAEMCDVLCVSGTKTSFWCIGLRAKTEAAISVRFWSVSQRGQGQPDIYCAYKADE